MHSQKEEQQAKKVMMTMGVSHFGIGHRHVCGLTLTGADKITNDMPQEIERKFLVTENTSLTSVCTQDRIVQGYISSAWTDSTGAHTAMNGDFSPSKGASNESGTSRYEWEKEIPLCEARELLKLCEPGVIDKTRYLICAADSTSLRWMNSMARMRD